MQIQIAATRWNCFAQQKWWSLSSRFRAPSKPSRVRKNAPVSHPWKHPSLEEEFHAAGTGWMSSKTTRAQPCRWPSEWREFCLSPPRRAWEFRVPEFYTATFIHSVTMFCNVPPAIIARNCLGSSNQARVSAKHPEGSSKTLSMKSSDWLDETAA